MCVCDHFRDGSTARREWERPEETKQEEREIERGGASACLIHIHLFLWRLEKIRQAFVDAPQSWVKYLVKIALLKSAMPDLSTPKIWPC